MNNISDLQRKLELAQSELCQHPLYENLNSPSALRLFMHYHVFAVWDFMSLLKGLQRGLTCVELPWRPSRAPKEVTRFINEIVLGEESDLDQNGEACDHFSLYLRAMEEIGVDPFAINHFIESFDFDYVPEGARSFVEYNLNLAQSSNLHCIAAAFFYGREKLIPEMFERILKGLGDKKSECPALVYYLERHIELDGDEHSHLAELCLQKLCQDDPLLLDEAYQTGIKSLQLRAKLWDAALVSIKKEAKVMHFLD